MTRRIQIASAILISISVVRAGAGPSCVGNSAHQTERRGQLQKIFEEDQSDRDQFKQMRDEALAEMVKRDRAHAKIVNQIANENCLKTAKDYLMAAKVMMHVGTTANFLKAFSWAKKAHDLGDHSASAKITLAQSIDRYLVQTGHKQIFASQARQDSDAHCWCLNSVEKKFPESLRVSYSGRTLDGAFDWVDSMNQGLGCHLGRYCKDGLKDTPRGLAPGVW